MKWLKIHGKWLLILTIAMSIFLVWGIIEAVTFKKNNTEAHRQIADHERRIERLER